MNVKIMNLQTCLKQCLVVAERHALERIPDGKPGNGKVDS